MFHDKMYISTKFHISMMKRKERRKEIRMSTVSLMNTLKCRHLTSLVLGFKYPLLLVVIIHWLRLYYMYFSYLL